MIKKIDQWKEIPLYGRHPRDLSKPKVDKIASNACLKSEELFLKTDEFMVVIQDEVVNTRNYQKHISNDGIIQDDRC